MGGEGSRNHRLIGFSGAQRATLLRATAHSLLDLKALELRVAEIERPVVAGPVMRGTKRFRLRPGLEGSVVSPHRVRGVKRVVLGLGPFQQVELDETGDLVEMSVARLPDLLEGSLRAFGD